MYRIPLALVALALLPVLAAGADCERSKTLDAVLDATGATSLEIDAEAGSLRVEGRRGSSEVRVDGRACASSESRLEDIELITRRDGDHLLVRAKIRDFDSWRKTYARLDLTIIVPADLALEVSDGSGETEISDVLSLDLSDGSGAIDVRRIAGDVRIKDGSGEIDLESVEGGVRINDGSGGIWVRDVGQTVLISDGSGEIDIDDVNGDVEISDDGSGGISIRNVGGHVMIGSDGSGSIHVAFVGGDFTVRSDGSGSIRIDDVKGKVSVP